MRYRAIYREGDTIHEIEVHRPNAPSREGMEWRGTGRTWPAIREGERAAKAAIAEANGAL